MKVAADITRTHNPFDEDYWASCLRENLTSSSNGEGLETGREYAQEPRQSFTRQRGFHRFKKGHIPALPLFLRLTERIKGLMLLLTIALQVLTLMEFVSRRELSKNDETISGLVPGNPKMKTSHPTAERLLSQFGNLHLLIEEKGKNISGVMVEGQCH